MIGYLAPIRQQSRKAVKPMGLFSFSSRRKRSSHHGGGYYQQGGFLGGLFGGSRSSHRRFGHDPRYAQPYPAPQAPSAAPQAAQSNCPHCGSTVPAGSKFCLNCGKEIGGGFCPQCGSALAPGAKFCSECGSPRA